MAGLEFRTIGVPLPQGKTTTIYRETAVPAGVRTTTFTIDADNLLVSVYVDSVGAGTLDVEAFTQTEDGKEKSVILFPTISSPTSELLIRKSAVTMSVIKLVVTTTGVASFDIRARGIATGESSVKISGSASLSTIQITVPTTPTILVPFSLTDRNGLIIKNWNSPGGADLYIADNSGEANTADGYPIAPGEALSIDVTGGVVVYGAASFGTVDVRILEAGG